MRAFYEPVALTPSETRDVAFTLHDASYVAEWAIDIHWHRPPWGVLPDMYLSHLRCVDLEDDEEDEIDDIDDFITFPEARPGYRAPRIALDAQGMHAGRPVCLLGEEDAQYMWRLLTPEHAAGLLRQIRQCVYRTLETVCVRYTLARQMLGQHLAWNNHHLIWTDPDTAVMLALANVPRRLRWQQPGLGMLALRRSHIALLPYDQDPGIDARQFQPLPFWQILWDYIQRCPLSEVRGTFAPNLSGKTVHLHRTDHLPPPVMGHVARALLLQLEGGAQSIQNICALMRQQSVDEEELLRALVGLLFTRSITTTDTSGGLARASMGPDSISAP